MENNWQEKLRKGQIVLIDGATGTELQKRGVPMDRMAWSGAGILGYEKIVREVHEDYIRAGAEVIMTNTFGTTRLMLEPAGLGDKVELINKRAVELALQARENSADHGVAIAGSLSAMPAGFDRKSYPSPEAELDAYREVAFIFAELGVDLIALEMLVDIKHASLLIQAAKETHLPVWFGISCWEKVLGNGITSLHTPELSLEDMIHHYLASKPAIINLMHSDMRVMEPALKIVQQKWKGPMGVYPESGHFKHPDWQFVDVVAPKDLVTEARKWVAGGARLLGGCCGTGPEHIQALHEALPELSKITETTST